MQKQYYDGLYPMRMMMRKEEPQYEPSYSRPQMTREPSFGTREAMLARQEEERIRKEEASIKRRELEQSARRVKEQMNKKSDEEIRKREEADNKVREMYGWNKSHECSHYEQPETQHYDEYDDYYAGNNSYPNNDYGSYEPDYNYQVDSCEQKHYAQPPQAQTIPSPPREFDVDSVNTPWSDEIKVVKPTPREPVIKKPKVVHEEPREEHTSKQKPLPKVQDEDDGIERRRFKIRTKYVNRTPLTIHRGSEGLTQYFTCFDLDKNKLAAKVAMYFDDINSTIEMINDKGEELAVVKKIILALRPCFHVKQEGIMIGKSTQRFKLKQRKFNYIRQDTGEELKMIGNFGASWKVTKEHRVIANIKNHGPDTYDIDIETKDNYDILHILVSTFIMIEQRYSTNDDRKAILSEQSYSARSFK
jgi:uncharacterized protein YxjI